MDFQGGKGLKTHPPSTILQVAFKLDAVEWPSCFLFPFGFAGCGAASQMLHQILHSSKLPGFAPPTPPPSAHGTGPQGHAHKWKEYRQRWKELRGKILQSRIHKSVWIIKVTWLPFRGRRWEADVVLANHHEASDSPGLHFYLIITLYVWPWLWKPDHHTQIWAFFSNCCHKVAHNCLSCNAAELPFPFTTSNGASLSYYLRRLLKQQRWGGGFILEWDAQEAHTCDGHVSKNFWPCSVF